jgi:hypothetical protein
MRAKNKIFHLECFRCVACDKQLVPGDEFALRPDGLFCKEDHTGAEEEDDGKEENSNNRRQDDFGEDSQDCRDLLMLDEHFVDSGK